jgi:hypothetical protein
VNTQQGYRNLIDTTLLLTPSPKFNAYINYDYGQNRDAITVVDGEEFGDNNLNHWQGVAFAAHYQATGTSAFAGRYEYYNDPNGYETGTVQHVQEFTGTYEYKWAAGLLSRVEVRHDWSDVDFFHKGNTGLVQGQTTATVGFVAFFGPKR